MRHEPIVKQVHRLLTPLIQPGDLALDATLGGGRDCLFLAQQVGSEGRVFGFDLQPQALRETRHRLATAGLEQRVELFLDSHTQLRQRIGKRCSGRLRVALFNLGFLPGADPSITTQTQSTLEALEQAQDLLIAGGALAVTSYPGHRGGAAETAAVARWLLERENDGESLLRSRWDSNTAPRFHILIRN